MKQFLALAALAHFVPCSSISAQEQENIVWLNSLPEATEIARDAGLPMLVVFR